MNRLVQVVFWLASGAGALGCASSPPPLSAAVQHLAGVECPEDRIQVLETRDVEGDTTYVVDACGKRLEVVRGLVLPERKSQLMVSSEEGPLDYPKGLGPLVPEGITAIVREKVQHWCHAKPPSDPDAIDFSGATLEECRKRLSSSLAPVGTEPGHYGESDIYWFSLGKYVFTASEALTAPGASAKQVPVAIEPSRKRKETIWYSRIELGTGYLGTSEASSQGASFHFRPQFGLKLTSDFAFGLVTANHIGFSEKNPVLYEAGLTSLYYPIPNEGFHLGASVSVASLRFSFGGEGTAGPLFGAGVGYDVGARSKSETGNWSGLGLTLHGFYGTFDNVEVTSASLYLGWYWW